MLYYKQSNDYANFEKKTPSELFKERKPNISYFHPFGCKFLVLNNGKDNLGKFDAKSDEGIFLGYFFTSKAFRVFNKRTLVVEESIHVIFDESNSLSRKDSLDDDNIGILQEDIDKASHQKEKDQKAITIVESNEEELYEPQALEKQPSFLTEKLYVKDGEVI